jgi:hypothetical protein
MKISRRKFAQLLGAGAAAAVTRPALILAKPPVKDVAASLSGVVRLSSNENPYGPSAKALQAMTDSFGGCAIRRVCGLIGRNGAKTNGVSR